MSDNVPAVRDEPAREVARTDTDSWIPVLANVIELANAISATDFVPKGLRGSATATAAAILYGREVGLPPMTALTQTHVIDGKPAMSAEAMRAMVLAAGHQIVIDQTTGAQCTMRGRRAGTDDWTSITWTIDMARAAGVGNKMVWKQYPRQMLQARATTELVRLVFPDVIHGFRSIEEFNELDGAVVEDEDGNTAPAAKAGTVTRRRATKKAAAAPRVASVAADAADMDGPPLPGAEAPASVGQSPAGGETADAMGVADGEDVEPPAGDDQDDVVDVTGAVVLGQVGEHPEPEDGIVDADVVEDPPADVDERPPPGPSTRAQHRMLFGLFSGFDIEEDGERLAYTSALAGREVESFTKLTKAEASRLIESMSFVDGDRAKLDALVDEAGSPS